MVGKIKLKFVVQLKGSRHNFNVSKHRLCIKEYYKLMYFCQDDSTFRLLKFMEKIFVSFLFMI